MEEQHRRNFFSGKNQEIDTFKHPGKSYLNLKYFEQALLDMVQLQKQGFGSHTQQIRGFKKGLQAIQHILSQEKKQQYQPVQIFTKISQHMMPKSFPTDSERDKDQIQLLYQIFRSDTGQIRTRSPLYNSQGRKRQIVEQKMKDLNECQKDFSEQQYRQFVVMKKKK